MEIDTELQRLRNLIEVEKANGRRIRRRQKKIAAFRVGLNQQLEELIKLIAQVHVLDKELARAVAAEDGVMATGLAMDLQSLLIQKNKLLAVVQKMDQRVWKRLAITQPPSRGVN